MARGDLAHRVPLEGHGELTQMGRELEAMCQSLSGMVAEIRSFATRVHQAGADVAGSSRVLAEASEAQSATLRQAVVTVGQLSATVQGHSSQTHQLEQTASVLRQDAEAGGQAMAHGVQAMQALDASARRMAEIRQLIEQSPDQTATSSQRITAASRTLQSVLQGVHDVTSRLQLVARDSLAQSRGLQAMSASVGQLDEITRRNASVVQVSAQAARTLVERAQSLDEAVGTMRLRQGTADEARLLVQRAQQLVAAQGLAAAAPRLRGAASGFVDRDLYVFIVDRCGQYRLHGARPAAEGQRVHDVPGINGDRFVTDAFAATDGGEGGWIEYEILNAESSQVQPKSSYVVRLQADLVMGCGV